MSGPWRFGTCSFLGAIAAAGNVLAAGGFLESSTTNITRPLLSAVQIQQFLPTGRGSFVFPSPYNTEGIRLTNSSDCIGETDCVFSVGYSYWRNINNHVGSDTMLIFLGTNRNVGGAGVTLFSYNKLTKAVQNLGPIFDSSSGYSWNSGEGWYFSGTKPTKIYLNDGPRMLRYDVLAKQFETVFDVSTPYPNNYIWQLHSSDDDRVHSVSLRDNGTAEMLGCLVYHEDTRQYQYFPKIRDFDECHVDKSGRWLMSLENIDGQYDLEMRIFDLSNGSERMVWDQDGALGHLDMGYGYGVGPDNWDPKANAMYVWDFFANPLSKLLVQYSMEWVPAPNHITHGNARPGVPSTQQFACGSGATRNNLSRSNEIICFRLDGSQTNNILIVAPVMTNLDAAGGGDDYSKMPKANIDVTGEYMVWTSNMGGPRQDAFLVKVPCELLTGVTPTPTPTPTATPTVTPTPTPVPTPTNPVLLGYWNLNEGSGVTASDSSGNSHNGSLLNGPTWTSSDGYPALALDGVDDYVNVTHASDLNAFPLSLATWIKTSASGLNGIVNKYLPASLNGYQLFVNGGDLCAWYFRDGSDYVWDGGTCSLRTSGYADNQWHFVVFVVDSTGGKLYVDGIQKASLPWTGTSGAPSTTTNLVFGQYPQAVTPYFAGSLDEIRVYQGALSPSDIQALFSARTPIVTPTPTPTATPSPTPTPTPVPGSPWVSLSASPATGKTPLQVNFMSAATDPNGDPLTYRWFFGDGTVNVAGTPEQVHTYSKGKFTACVVVDDGQGNTATACLLIQVVGKTGVSVTSIGASTTLTSEVCSLYQIEAVEIESGEPFSLPTELRGSFLLSLNDESPSPAEISACLVLGSTNNICLSTPNGAPECWMVDEMGGSLRLLQGDPATFLIDPDLNASSQSDTVVTHLYGCGSATTSSRELFFLIFIMLVSAGSLRLRSNVRPDPR